MIRLITLTTLYFTVVCFPFLSLPQASKSHYGKFSESQWWIGLRIGLNQYKGTGDNTYTTATILSNDDSPKTTSYGKFDDLGWSLGLELTYDLPFLSFSFLPKFRVSTFDYSWTITRTSSTETVMNIYNQETEIQSFSLPLQARCVFLQDKKFKPSLFVGAYIDIVNYSLASITTQEVQTNTVSNTSTTSEESFLNSIIISNKLNPINYGVYGGVGFTYDINNIRVGLDMSYQVGLSNMADEDTRFNDNDLNTIDGALDDFKLQAMQVELTVGMPLKFIYDRAYNRVR